MKRWALVTGSARRIGRAIALELAGSGWDIVVHYNMSCREAEKTAQDIQDLGRKAYLAELDLAHLATVEKLIPALSEELGPPGALINNAALFVPDATADSAAHHAINVGAVQILSETFYRQHCRDSSPLEGEAGWEVVSTKTKLGSSGTHPPSSSPLKGGRTSALSYAPVIVNILDSDPTAPKFSRYNASKAAVRDMTLVMAARFAPHLRVSGVALGPVLPAARQSPEHFKKLVARTPLGIAIPPEAVAQAVRFLIENEAVTGTIIPVDGGLHLKG